MLGPSAGPRSEYPLPVWDSCMVLGDLASTSSYFVQSGEGGFSNDKTTKYRFTLEAAKSTPWPFRVGVVHAGLP